MKKILLFVLLILSVGFVLSCLPSIESAIVGSWESQYPSGATTTKQKYTFNSDKTFFSYMVVGTGIYTEVGSGTYSIDVSKSRLTLIITKAYGSPIEDYVIIETLSIGDNKMCLNAVMVGGDTKTLIGIWNSYDYMSYNGVHSIEKIFDFKTDGTLTMTRIIVDGAEPEETIANAKWSKVSDSEFTVSESDNESVLSNGSVPYQIIGDGISTASVDMAGMYFYTKMED